MSPLQRATSSSAALFQRLPVPARITAVIIGALTLFYLWQILLGLLFLAAFGVGLVQMVKWFVK